MAKGEGLYLGLILVWAGPFVLLLWYASLPVSAFDQISHGQESCIPIHLGTSTFEHSPTNCIADIVSMGSRHLGAEARYLGY